MSFNRDKAKAAGYTDEQIDSYLKAKEFADKQVEPEGQGTLGFLKSAGASLARPFTQTIGRVGEAAYQTGVSALPQEAENRIRQQSPTATAFLQNKGVSSPIASLLGMDESELQNRGQIIGDTARSTAGLGAYAVPTSKLSGILNRVPLGGAMGRGGLAGAGLTAAQPETGAGEIASGALLGGATAGAFKYLPKTFHPF